MAGGSIPGAARCEDDDEETLSEKGGMDFFAFQPLDGYTELAQIHLNKFSCLVKT